MTKETQSMIKDMLTNKDAYLDLAGRKRGELETAYVSLESAFRKYHSSLLNETLSRIGYDKALKEKKIDPYLAGGAASAIGGTGLGLSAGVSSAARNQKIQDFRDYYREKVDKDSLATSQEEKKLLVEAKKTYKIIDSIKAIREYRAKKAEEEIEKKYQEAKARMDSTKMYNGFSERKLAYDTFVSLGDYKDSVELAEKCKSLDKEGIKKGGRFIRNAFLCIVALIVVFNVFNIIESVIIKNGYQKILDESMSRVAESEYGKEYGLSNLEYEITDFKKTGEKEYCASVKVSCTCSSEKTDALAWEIAGDVPGSTYNFKNKEVKVMGSTIRLLDLSSDIPSDERDKLAIYINGKHERNY